MSRTSQTRSRVRELAEELSLKGEEPTPTVILRLLGKGSPNTVVDELRKWREENARPTQHADYLPRRTETATSSHPDPSLLRELLEPVTAAIQALTQRLDEQDKSYAAQLALAYDRFTAVQKMAMVAIDEAREQARFWKQEAERVKLETAVQADTYRDAMKAAQAEARRLSELLQAHQDAPSSLPREASTIVPPTPSIAALRGPAKSQLSTPGPAGQRHYDPDGRSDE